MVQRLNTIKSTSRSRSIGPSDHHGKYYSPSHLTEREPFWQLGQQELFNALEYWLSTIMDVSVGISQLSVQMACDEPWGVVSMLTSDSNFVWLTRLFSWEESVISGRLVTLCFRHEYPGNVSRWSFQQTKVYGFWCCWLHGDTRHWGCIGCKLCSEQQSSSTPSCCSHVLHLPGLLWSLSWWSVVNVVFRMLLID